MTTTAEKIAVMQAFEEGKKIEFFYKTFNKWEQCSNPIWDWVGSKYRIAVTKPSINWDHVSPEYNWLVRDKSGGPLNCYLFSKKPTPSEWDGSWDGDAETKWASAEGFVSLDRGTCDWKDSLVMRPNYKGD